MRFHGRIFELNNWLSRNLVVSDLNESLWRVYTSTNEWIRFSDAKAGIVLATEGVVVGVVYSNISSLRDIVVHHPAFFYFLLACSISGAVSFYFSVRCLLPTVSVGDLTSVLFFGQIARHYKDPSSYENAAKDLLSDSSHIRAQLSQQVWANSKIAAKKFALVNRAISYFAITMLLGLIGVIVVILD